MTDVLRPSFETGSSSPVVESSPTARVEANGPVSEWPEGVPRRMSFEEYLAWDHEGVRAEWVDGEVVIVASVRLDHQFIMGFLYRLVIGFVERESLGVVLLPSTRMRLPEKPSGREPDLLFVAASHADRLKETYVDGPADLVVEIVSPDSEIRDRADKFLEYEAAGITEYWLLDPLRHEAFFYVLGDDARYHPRAVATDGVYHSHVLDRFRLRPDWLWRTPLPTPEAALAELND
jgi:Uma2 family endonuclease